jgi:sRNA-binding carbon storage regulator CsrA
MSTPPPSSALVLTRKLNQAIVIETPEGPVKVTRLSHGRMKIEAPRCIEIRRAEREHK